MSNVKKLALEIPTNDGVPDEFLRKLNDRLRRIEENFGGVSREPVLLSGMHLIRVRDFPPAKYADGSLFFETDRTVGLIKRTRNGVQQWWYEFGTYRAPYAKRPTDLGSSDAGFLFYATDRTITFRWSGTVWNYESGAQRDTLANIVTPSANEGGYLYFATDYEHLFRWSGTAWVFAPGDMGSDYFVATHGSAPRGGLWGLCDGTAYNVATAAGGTVSVTTPNLNSGAFLRGGAYTGAINAASRSTWEVGARTDAGGIHNHEVTPSCSLSGRSDGDVDAALCGFAIPTTNDGGHVHTLDGGDALLKVPSDANGGLPANIALTWYIRR
jgi:hypothetical protein